MAAPDLRGTGLDPAHILAICEHVAHSGGWQPVGYVTAVPGGVRVQLRATRAVRAMRAALTRAGYRTELTRPGRRWDLVVTGWDADALEWRLAAMRAVIAQLSADPAATAAAVIRRYRELSARSPGSRLGVAALTKAGEELRAAVAGRCGSYVPRNPAILPAQIATALRLRAIWVLEQAIADLIEQHLRIARRALPLFRTLRQHTTDDRAQEAAICRAVGFVPRAGRPADRETPGRVALALWPSQPAPPPAGSRRPSGRNPGPAQQAALGFPRTAASALAAAAGPLLPGAATPLRAHAGMCDLPGRRPRHRP